MTIYNFRKYRQYKDERRVSISLLKTIGFEDQDGFEDILDNFRYLGGRRFHNTPSNYFLPNDKIEADRLNLSHCLFRHAFGGNYSSPIQNRLKDGITVLDIGCGAGSWVIENAKEYPKSTFVGIDMSPIFQTENKPWNAGFIECDVLNGLPFPSNTFDFVHQRLLYTAFTEKQWIKLIHEIIRVLKPSGYVEFMELNKVCNSGPQTKEILNKVIEYYNAKDIFLEIPKNLKKLMNSTKCLSEVKIENRNIPLGKWNGEFGEFMLKYYRMSIDSYSVMWMRKLKLTDQEYHEKLKHILEEAEEYKSSLLYTRFYAQKI